MVFSDKTIKQYDGQYWKKVKKGMMVDIEVKRQIIRVLVEKVITKQLYHPQGIEIETSDGIRGRVKNIIKQVYDERIVLKGDFNTLNKMISKLQKYPINIISNNRKLLWKHFDNPMESNTMIQVMLGDAINRKNYKLTYNPPYAVFYIRNNEIIGIEYYDYNGNLQFDFKNEDFF